MHSLKTLTTAFGNFGGYVRADAKYFFLSSLGILALASLSILFPIQRDWSGHNITPPGVTFLMALVSLVGFCLFLAIALRSYTWLSRKPFDLRSTIRSLASYIWPAMSTLICMAFLYYAVPYIVLLILTAHDAPDARRRAMEIFFACYSGPVAFLSLYILPLLIMERQTAFRNIVNSLRIAIREAPLSAVLRLPGYVLAVVVLYLARNSLETIILRLVLSALTLFGSLLAMFVYVVVVQPESGTNSG